MAPGASGSASGAGPGQQPFNDFHPLVSLGFSVFFAFVVKTSLEHKDIFFKRSARRHRLCGLWYLACLLLGFADVHLQILNRTAFDIVLGISGIILTLTAAFDFKSHHEKIKNRASGTLEENATVTYSEMIEHSFYQALNLVQITYLHVIWRLNNKGTGGRWGRAMLAFLTVLPWAIRGWFPVNRFSDNYKGGRARALTLIGILYRIKKYQYVFYKHFVLFGLNISIALEDDLNRRKLAEHRDFQMFWMGLNCAYVMEFFLQTLVKRKKLKQSYMLGLQNLLMLCSSVAAVPILLHVNIGVAFLSLVLNFCNRKHDVLNGALVILFGLWMRRYAYI